MSIFLGTKRVNIEFLTFSLANNPARKELFLQMPFAVIQNAQILPLSFH